MNWYKKWRKKRERIKKAIAYAKLIEDGMPVNVIQGVATAGKSSRNIARIKTCEAVMATLRLSGIDRIDPVRYNKWADEHKRRMERYHINDRRAD